MSDLLAEPSAHAETVARLAEVEKQLDAANLEIGRLSVDAARTPKPMDTRNYLEGFLIGAASCGIGTTVANGHWGSFTFYLLLGIAGFGWRARRLMGRG